MVWVAPDESARFGEATPIRAVARRSRYVPRRVTSRDRRRASKNRAIRVQGGRHPERHLRAKMVVVKTPSEGKPSMGKSIRNLSTVTRVGLDLAKRVFQFTQSRRRARSLWCANSRAAS